MQQEVDISATVTGLHLTTMGPSVVKVSLEKAGQTWCQNLFLTTQVQGCMFRDYVKKLSQTERDQRLPEFLLYYLSCIAALSTRWSLRDLGAGNISVLEVGTALEVKFVDSKSWIKRTTPGVFPPRRACHGSYGIIQTYCPQHAAYLESPHGMNSDRALVLLFSLLTEEYRTINAPQSGNLL